MPLFDRQRWQEKNFGVRKITNFTELALPVMLKSPERKSSNFLFGLRIIGAQFRTPSPYLNLIN
jgi:hypothetical protein